MHLFYDGKRYVIIVAGEEAYAGGDGKRAIRACNKMRTNFEKQFPAHELTKDQKHEALRKLAGDSVLREVRNSTRKSKIQES